MKMIQIPNFVYQSIVQSRDIDDGDVWPVRDGWSVEYDKEESQKFGQYTIKHRGKVVGVVSKSEARRKYD